MGRKHLSLENLSNFVASSEIVCFRKCRHFFLPDPDYCSNLASLWDYVHNQKSVIFVYGCSIFWGDLMPNVA